MKTEYPKPEFCQRCKKPVTEKEIFPGTRGNYVAMCKECEKWIKEQTDKLRPLMGALFRR